MDQIQTGRPSEKIVHEKKSGTCNSFVQIILRNKYWKKIVDVGEGITVLILMVQDTRRLIKAAQE